MEVVLVLQKSTAEVFVNWLIRFVKDTHVLYSSSVEVESVVYKLNDHSDAFRYPDETTTLPGWIFQVIVLINFSHPESHDRITFEVTLLNEFRQPGIEVKIKARPLRKESFAQRLFRRILERWPETEGQFIAQDIIVGKWKWERIDIDLTEKGWERRLPPVQVMRQHYKHYTPSTAREIIEAIPKAWELYDRKRDKRWGPGVISRSCNLGSTTIGRYLKALKAEGITRVSGTPIP